MADSALALLLINLPEILVRLHTPARIATAVVLALAIGAVLILREKLRKYLTRSWPVSTGTVSNVQVKKVDGGINGIDYWKVSFEYTYSVAQEHSGKYSFNCTSELMGQGAAAGMADKTVAVHYKPSNESKALLWEDEIWDIWWDTYWDMAYPSSEAAPS
jgi:hypothetical protein